MGYCHKRPLLSYTATQSFQPENNLFVKTMFSRPTNKISNSDSKYFLTKNIYFFGENALFIQRVYESEKNCAYSVLIPDYENGNE